MHLLAVRRAHNWIRFNPRNPYFAVNYGPIMRLLGHIGSMILNTHRDNVMVRTLRRQRGDRLKRTEHR